MGRVRAAGGEGREGPSTPCPEQDIFWGVAVSFVNAFGAQETLLWLATVCGRGNPVFRKPPPPLP